ncbi:MAG: glutamate--tRNA ligase, partial [Solirubrobacterales bacterium]
EVAEWRKENGGRGYRGPLGAAGGRESAAVRLRVPDEGETVVTDLIRGEIGFENRLQDDPVIARSDGTALYNFAVAVDDADMGITDVVRGDDHLSNTPRQLLVFEALEIDPPRYAHLPLLHGPDGKKLSKRHGAASVQELRDGGYLPEAVRNYLALLGWGSTDDTDLISTSELVERFEIERVGKASAIFDEKKLRWMNGRYMRESDLPSYERRLETYLAHNDAEAASAFAAGGEQERRAACAIVQEKAQTMAEVWELIDFLFTEPDGFEEKAWKKAMRPQVEEPLRLAREQLAGLEPFTEADVERALRALMEEREIGARSVLQPIRVAITGKGISPGIFESIAALGREATISRLDTAIERLSGQLKDSS